MTHPPHILTLVALQALAPRPSLTGDAPSRPGSIRQRVRAWRVRTTLGPTGGDHPSGESQWTSRPGSYPMGRDGRDPAFGG
jgi:hypothetical protein